MSRPPRHPNLRFRVLARDGTARAATFSTPHGDVATPVFMPVATRASLKGLTNAHVEAIGPGLVLANTYHLHLRPGEDVIHALGGLHGFTGIHRPWITDSGGYQVFSLTDLVRVTDDGARLQSHLDGEPLFLGPREAMAIQEALGADLVMAFDHCLALPAPREALSDAVDRTTRWARACAEARTRDDQALFGIVQGGTDLELRERSARELADLDLPGYALGGLAVGEAARETNATVRTTTGLLPHDRPRYLMGVGTPVQILDAIAAGIDLFDCVLPTRLGRRGHLYTRDGIVRITHRRYERSDEALDPECPCEVCRTASRAYLRHLFAVGEQTATTLGTLHNVTFYVQLMREAREEIREGTFAAFRAAFIGRYEAGEAAERGRQRTEPHGAGGGRRAHPEREARREADPRCQDATEEGLTLEGGDRR
ncbi:MAG: tRNA guanosine(34) transglycosylase Tgt [Planctomycetota bacterium]